MENHKLFHKVTTDHDWEVFLDIENKAASASPYYLAFTNMKDLKQFIGDSVVYILYVNDIPVGHVEYEVKDQEAEITGFVVLPEYRGKGYGKVLFSKAMDDLRNVPLVHLMTHPKNSIALQIYLSAGFTIVAWKDNFYGNGQPRLRLELQNK